MFQVMTSSGSHAGIATRSMHWRVVRERILATSGRWWDPPSREATSRVRCSGQPRMMPEDICADVMLPNEQRSVPQHRVREY
jgi:hypothetical protein